MTKTVFFNFFITKKIKGGKKEVMIKYFVHFLEILIGFSKSAKFIKNIFVFVINEFKFNIIAIK